MFEIKLSSITINDSMITVLGQKVILTQVYPAGLFIAQQEDVVLTSAIIAKI